MTNQPHVALDAALTDRERIAAMAAAYPDAVADLTWAEIEAVLASLPQETAEPVAWCAAVNPYGQPGFEYARTEQALIDKGLHHREPLYTHPASPPVGGAVKVKPLEWRRLPLGGFAAEPPLAGIYNVYPVDDDTRWIWTRNGSTDNDRTHYATIDAAKAAAQADFEQRILSSLASSERSGREAEYVPTIIRNDGAGFYEFVTEDVPALYSGIMAANVERIGTLKGDLIGFRIYDPLEPRASERERTIGECAKVANEALTTILAQLPKHINLSSEALSAVAAIRKLSEVSHEH